MVLSSIYNISGLIAGIAAVWFTIRPRAYSILLAYIALVLFFLGNSVWLTRQDIINYGLAALCIYFINSVQTVKVEFSTTAAAYMNVGTYVCMVLAYLIYPESAIIGAFVGSVLGLLAYVKTPAGKNMGFHGSLFFNYFCAYGLRIFIVAALLGLVIVATLSKFIIMAQLPEY